MATTEASPRVRAVARVGAQALPELERPTLRRSRRPGHLGGVSVLQIIGLEVGLVLAVVAWHQPPWVMPAALTVAAVIPVAGFVRYRGRWWTEGWLLRVRYRRRRASARLIADDRRLTAVRDLVPELTLETVDGVGSAPLGIGRDSAGWFATIAVTLPRNRQGEPHPIPPFDLLARAVAEADQPGAVVQVVIHTTPAAVASGQLCVESYRELLAPIGGAAGSVADQICWVSLRVDARVMAEIAVETPAVLSEVPKVLAALVRRISNVLKRAGFSYQALDQDGLLDALVHSLAVEVTPPGTARTPAVESWRGWRSGGLDHHCFWVRNWPALAEAGPLLTELYRSPAALTSLSVVLWPGPTGTEFRCLARIADPPATVAAATSAIRAAAKERGARLFPLDGEQAPAVYATAPTGGGAQ